MRTQKATTRYASRGTGTVMAAGMLLLLAACGSSTGGNDTAAAAGSPAANGGTGAKEITVRSTDVGKALVDEHGRTMYAFAADSKGQSRCAGSCLTYWPPVSGAEKAHVAKQVHAVVGSITRKDGSTQLTVAGYPVYTYVGDSAPGQATGQGTNLSGGLWWVVAPDGTWIKTAAASGGSGNTGGY
jgi:predicted lipoprotein with Yx(FWY)xxD motif